MDVVSLRVSGQGGSLLSPSESPWRESIVRDGVGPGEAVHKNATGLLGRGGREEVVREREPKLWREG